MGRHAISGKQRRYSEADIAKMERLNETMSLHQIGLLYGVSATVIKRQLAEHGTSGDAVYKPRVLAPWPRGHTFKHDNLAVRD